MATITLSSLYNYSANIIAYNATTKIATLDRPVGVSMGVNTTVGGDITSKYSIRGTLTNVAKAIKLGTALPVPSTDESGSFSAIFNVPAGMFQTGHKVFRIDNRITPTSESSATTYAEATFTASGLSVQSQLLGLSPAVDSSVSSFTQTSKISSEVVKTIDEPNPFDPIAQTFLVTKDVYPNGIFLSSVKLFFRTKPASSTPITISIIPTINGYPAGLSLDYSTVTLTPDKVKTSLTPHYLDTTAFTAFTFAAPVYIQSGVLYAILIKSNDKEYTLYYAQQNEFAIPSSAKAKLEDEAPTNPTKIGAAPYVGALFASQNGITWTADQSKDLMFVIDRCVFNTGTSVIPFTTPRNLPYRKTAGDDILLKMNANSVSQLSGNYSRSVLVDAINVTTTDFIPTDTSINYSYSSTLFNGNVQTPIKPITPGKLGMPTPDQFYLNDGLGQRVLYNSTDQSFALYATISSSDPNVSPIISDDGVSLYTIRYSINNMGISNNVISIANPGYGYNIANATVVITSALTGSNTTNDLGGPTPIFKLTANTLGALTSVYTTNPGSGYLVTPTITILDPLTRAGNANAVVTISGETSPTGGNAIAKYFTKKVVLVPGNDSADLRVFYTAYRPNNTQIYVYYKILSSQDASVFETSNWQLMATVGSPNIFSTSRTNLIEYECAPGVFSSNQANTSSISYTNSAGQTFNTFIQFAIKVVLASSDTTTVPFLTDIRALALPAATGI